MKNPKLESRAWLSLSCGLLLVMGVACRKHEPTPQKPAPSAASEASLRHTASSSPAASASACAPASPWPAPIALSALKTRPNSAPLSPLRKEPGLWLADQNSALLDATPDPAWAVGPITLEGDNSATRPVALARLPKALRSWLGRPVKVLGASGAVCETRLQRFALRAQITPDPRTAEHWEGCADGPAMPPETIAEEIWRLSAVGGRSLIAEFSAPCKGALLAVDPNLPTPAIAAPEPATADVGEAVLAAFRRLPAYAALQARYRAEHPGLEGAWDDRDARRSVSRLALPGRAELLFVSVETGSDCTGFAASLSALWDAGPNGAAKVLTAIDNHRLSPSAIVDLDDSGSAVLLGPDGPLRMRSVLRGGTYQRSFLSDAPYFAGPC
jgi:hypothetical protein